MQVPAAYVSVDDVSVPAVGRDSRDVGSWELDVDAERGMRVHVGRLRPCPVLGIRFTALGHNLERGAAGGSVLNAELARARGCGRGR